MTNTNIGKIKNLRTIKSLRSESLKIDLGKTYAGTLTAWLKKTPNATSYRSFSIIDNRYIYLSRNTTSDLWVDDVLITGVQGRWFFDVEFLPTGGEADEKKTILTGSVQFIDDITGSRGTEEFPTEN